MTHIISWATLSKQRHPFKWHMSLHGQLFPSKDIHLNYTNHFVLPIKRHLAANHAHEVATVDFLSRFLIGPLPCVRRQIIVKCVECVVKYKMFFRPLLQIRMSAVSSVTTPVLEKCCVTTCLVTTDVPVPQDKSSTKKPDRVEVDILQ